MNGEANPVKLELVDLWLEDNFLELGLRQVLGNIRFEHRDIRYVIFSANQYPHVKNHGYDLRRHCFILLSDGHLYNFLDSFSVNHISSKVTIGEMTRFLTSLRKTREGARRSEQKVKLSPRETTLINQMSDGKKINEMAQDLNVHIKTVYQIRSNLIKKLGCSGHIDFMQTLRTDAFKSWLTEQHV
ncbi:helix-turn-helix transcriptional regulator [Pseudocitrobacter cyperus]|uniref:LuxR C-terminal-related transcriptional regulator n=1 Tax=Pseudocitrobacter cyperus TaxID=3112843 RepID=A0ABV0HE54_9ENTR